MNRRSFLGTMLAFPAIVRAESLMPVRKILVPESVFFFDGRIWTGGSQYLMHTKVMSRHDFAELYRPADIIDYG